MKGTLFHFHLLLLACFNKIVFLFVRTAADPEVIRADGAMGEFFRISYIRFFKFRKKISLNRRLRGQRLSCMGREFIIIRRSSGSCLGKQNRFCSHVKRPGLLNTFLTKPGLARGYEVLYGLWNIEACVTLRRHLLGISTSRDFLSENNFFRRTMRKHFTR